MMSYVPGEIYEVPCAILLWKEDSRAYFVPVIDLPHTDLAFDFPHRHYHIDGRFEIHSRMAHQLQIKDGYTATILVTENSSLYDFKGIAKEKLKCVRTATGLAIPPCSNKYQDWYEGYVGQSCKDKRCPHLGTGMLEHDGKLVCPLHGLTADVNTLKIIPYHYP